MYHPDRKFHLTNVGVDGLLCERVLHGDPMCTEEEIGWFGWGLCHYQGKVYCGVCMKDCAGAVTKLNNRTAHGNWLPACSSCVAASQGYKRLSGHWCHATAEELCPDRSFIFPGPTPLPVAPAALPPPEEMVETRDAADGPQASEVPSDSDDSPTHQ